MHGETVLTDVWEMIPVRDISASAAPEDEMFKVLVVDVEQNMERKRRKGHK